MTKIRTRLFENPEGPRKSGGFQSPAWGCFWIEQAERKQKRRENSHGIISKGFPSPKKSKEKNLSSNKLGKETPEQFSALFSKRLIFIQDYDV